MLTGPEAETILREFETDVLDKHHETLGFTSRPSAIQRLALLCVYDNANLLAQSVFPPSPRVIANMRMYAYGLCQALKWCPIGKLDPANAPSLSDGAVKDAVEFLVHGYQYATVEQFHKKYGKQLVDCAASPDQKRIRFTIRKANSASLCYEATVDAYASLRSYRHSLTKLKSEQMRRADSAISSVTFEKDGSFLRLSELDSLDTDEVNSMLRALHDIPDVDLPAGTSLDGFTVGDLYAWWTAMWKWSHAAEYVHSELLERDSGTTVFPTQVIEFERFVGELVRLSHLSETSVRRITMRLTYEVDCPKPDPFLQPLIVIDNTVMWSTRVALEAVPIRNHLKLMSRCDRYRDVAATIIGMREPQVVSRAKTILDEHRYWSKPRTKLPMIDGEEGEVDLLAWTRRARREVLVIEIKAVLPCDDENEQAHVTRELAKGQQQLDKIIRILKRMPVADKTRLFEGVPWCGIEDYYGVLLSEQALPTHEFDHKRFPACSLAMISRRLRNRDLRTARRFWDVLSRREWLDAIAEQLTNIQFHEIVIGGVTYELPIMPDLAVDETG